MPEKKPIKIKHIEKAPEEMQIVFLEAVMMPNGEIISDGLTLSWNKNIKYVYEQIPTEPDTK